MVRVISELHPHWVLGENVSGFINMGLDKTIFDLEREGYAVQTFVYPACGVGVWHERTRTFIVALMFLTPLAFDTNTVKDSLRLNVFLSENGIFRKKNPNGAIWSLPLSAAVVYLTPIASDGMRSTFKPETMMKSKGKANLAAQIIMQEKPQSRLDGVVNGFSVEMDGHKLWQREPKVVLRITDETENRAERLKTLGNAVCPPQVFPILKCIADIETGKCKENCVFCEFC